jgi:lipoprotein-anchoring transpeptidase ErfK/SrfK
VSKGRQVLFLVRDGKVALIVQVSTGATGNTPLGHWRVYSKVPGFNALAMYYSSFFVGAFAIHGYHSVPPYPASHGCVRIPLWVAPRIYSLASYGTNVYIYW